MRIVLLEDDEMQSQDVKEALERSLTGVSVEQIYTESDFLRSIEGMRREPPDLAIIDVMVPWAAPGREIENPPAEIQLGGFRRAGMRCVEALLGAEETSQLPIILYTVLGRADVADQLEGMPDNVLFLEKQASLDRLILQIRSAMESPPEAVPENVRDQIWDSVELKPGVVGFKLDLKKIFRAFRKKENGGE